MDIIDRVREIARMITITARTADSMENTVSIDREVTFQEQLGVFYRSQ